MAIDGWNCSRSSRAAEESSTLSHPTKQFFTRLSRRGVRGMVARMRNLRWAVLAFWFSIAWTTVFAVSCLGQVQQTTEWPTYGNDAGGMRYSADTQINRGNVGNLKIAWTYRTGANDTPTKLKRKAAFEATPILLDGRLFLSTPYDHVIALDPGSGAKLWDYDPVVNLNRNYSEVSSRGVSAWHDASKKPGAPCKLRIFIGTLDARLIALDGENGRPCADFGAAGTVDLNSGAATQTKWTGATR